MGLQVRSARAVPREGVSSSGVRRSPESVDPGVWTSTFRREIPRGDRKKDLPAAMFRRRGGGKKPNQVEAEIPRLRQSRRSRPRILVKPAFRAVNCMNGVAGRNYLGRANCRLVRVDIFACPHFSTVSRVHFRDELTGGEQNVIASIGPKYRIFKCDLRRTIWTGACNKTAQGDT
jgi:hypothetical protein